MNRTFTLSEALMYGAGTERPFLCPVHGDSRPSASLNIIKKKWICYTCGAHGGLTGEDACIEPDYEVLKLWLNDKLAENRVYPEAWLSRYDAGPVHPYWLQRVGQEAARTFRLGYDPERNEATYPLRRSDGAVLGVVRRRLSDGDGPKYRYPKGVDVGRLLFNYTPAHTPSIVLVEGALDAIACWNAGIPAMAIYGARLSSHQVALIDRVDPDVVITGFDNDDAGWLAHRATELAFRHRLVEPLRWPASRGKDVDEIGIDQLTKSYERLASAGLGTVGSSTCRSSPPSSPLRSSRSTSKRSRLLVRPTSG